jgi:hypothetical protein
VQQLPPTSTKRTGAHNSCSDGGEHTRGDGVVTAVACCWKPPISKGWEGRRCSGKEDDVDEQLHTAHAPPADAHREGDPPPDNASSAIAVDGRYARGKHPHGREWRRWCSSTPQTHHPGQPAAHVAFYTRWARLVGNIGHRSPHFHLRVLGADVHHF